MPQPAFPGAALISHKPTQSHGIWNAPKHRAWQSLRRASPPHLGMNLLLPDEAVCRQPQLGYPGVPGILHQRADLVGLGDVV